MRLTCHLEQKKAGVGAGVWFGTSKGRKAIYMEMKKQMFGKQIFAGLPLTHRKDFDQRALLGSFLYITH